MYGPSIENVVCSTIYAGLEMCLSLYVPICHGKDLVVVMGLSQHAYLSLINTTCSFLMTDCIFELI
jgi:hypothetical protein